MKKVLVIGANGFTGRRILNYLKSTGKYSLVGISAHADIAPHEGFEFYELDIINSSELESLVLKIMPNVIINASALSVPAYCETHREEARIVNVSSVINMVSLCSQIGARFIHFSTDFVFDGTSEALYSETDKTQPVNYYGTTKLLGEWAVERESMDWAIARVVLIFGKTYVGQHGNIVELVKKKLEAGEEVRVVSDQRRTPTYVEDIAKATEALIELRDNGIFHICGKEDLTISEIAYRVAKHFGLPSNLIVPIMTAETGDTVSRPMHSGLSIEKAKAMLNYNPLSFDEALAKEFPV